MSVMKTGTQASHLKQVSTDHEQCKAMLMNAMRNQIVRKREKLPAGSPFNPR